MDNKIIDNGNNIIFYTDEEGNLKIEVVFDWLDLTVAQREDNVEKYKNLLFENNTSRIYFSKDEFKKEFAQYYKDREFKHHYMLTNNGVTEDEDARYCTIP